MELISNYKKDSHAVRQDSRRRSHPKKQAKKRIPQLTGNGFLRTCFKPVQVLPEALMNRKKVERHFFNSLQNLCSVYGWNIERNNDLCYPLNILTAFKLVQGAMEREHPDTRLIILQDENTLASITTEAHYDIGRMLYYIPIQPLYSMFRVGNRKAGNLLLSIFSCLYRLGVHHYQNGFVGGMYDTLLEWMEQGEYEKDENESFLAMQSDLRMADHFGKHFLKQLKHPYHCAQLETRIKNFRHRTESEKELTALACELVAIRKDFPKRHLMDSMAEPPDDENWDNEMTLPDEYLSFFWADCDSFYHSFWDLVNSSLQEHCDIIQPVCIQYFNRKQKAIKKDFSYEQRMFQFIDDLCTYLFKQP